MQIKEVIIVEGKNDENKLQSFFPNIKTYKTNGMGISKQDLKTIETFQKECGVILFLDPDGPGEKIRKYIQDNLEGEIKHCFIDKEKAKTTKKVGIEHANKEDILEALNKVVTFDNTNSDNNITMGDLCKLNLAGTPDSKSNREELCKELNISYCNAKRLLLRLKHLNISMEYLINVVNKCYNKKEE